jgi:hypothetical protein
LSELDLGRELLFGLRFDPEIRDVAALTEYVDLQPSVAGNPVRQ